MIDRVLCAKGRDSFESEYSPDDAITAVDLSSGRSGRDENLAVVFPPWHGGGAIINKLVSRLSQGGSVLEYRFHDRILEPNIETVPKSFETIRNKIVQDLHVIKGGFEKIQLVGLSLGNVALTLVAEEFPEYESASMIVPGSDLAACMWEGLRTRHVMEAFAKQGITKEQLRKDWKCLAPANHAAAFEDKDVSLHISSTDKIIPAVYQLEMEDSLQQAGARVSSVYRRMGHVSTLTQFCIKG
jgi:hypothetical protein